MLYLGIDQHRKQLTVNLRNEQGEIVLKRQVSTQWKRVRKFFEGIREQATPEGGFLAIVEVCGFNDWLLKMLAEYGCRETVLIQPEKRSKKKTDRRDASHLGELLWLNRHRLLAGQRVHGLRRVLPSTKEETQDRQLTALRDRLGRLQTKTINKIQHLLLKHNLQQECPTKGRQTKKARKWLKELTLGQIDRMELDLLLAQWDLWEGQLAEVEKRIQQRQGEHPTAPIVASMPGAGAYTSLALACRIGPIKRFARPGSLANFWGLTPSCRNSGEATDRLGSITKQGSAIVRHLLGQMVLHVLRRDPYMRNWYRRIKKRRGAKIARVAVMRRLATILWHMVKYEQPYAIGGPEQVRKMQAAFEIFG
ncbi:MAG: IS110 family transposase [Planctomycetes bacterium]|nr:IS110 family transposase [Planctomycetota bacterium]